VTRLVRAVDDSDEHETVMVLGGEHGVVTLHVSLCGIPQAEVLHSPREFRGWEGPGPCRRMEVPCWSLSSVTYGEMADLLAQYSVGGEEALWRLMEDGYRLYLKGGRCE
jgi:hypothetical protein